MRILALGPESHGGVAGMAQGTRDYLGALLAAEEVEELVLLARTPPARELPTPAGWSEACVPGHPVRFALEALRLQLTGRFDLLVCVHPNLMPVAAPLARAFGIPLWLMVHGIDAWEPRSPAIARAVRHAALVTSSSRYTRERFLAWADLDPARVHVLNNPVHLGRWGPGPKPEALLARYGLHGRRVLLTAGRLLGGDRFKGHDEILDVLPELRARHPNLAWLVVGDGPDRPRIEEAVRRAGFSEHVVFTGWIPDEERRDHYLVADAFALPSRTEGFGIVYLEAAACGLPVLGSVLDGSRDPLCDGELGLLVDPDDRVDLLEGLDSLLRRPRHVPEELARFTFERMAQRAHRLLRGLDLAPGTARRRETRRAA